MRIQRPDCSLLALRAVTFSQSVSGECVAKSLGKWVQTSRTQRQADEDTPSSYELDGARKGPWAGSIQEKQNGIDTTAAPCFSFNLLIFQL